MGVLFDSGAAPSADADEQLAALFAAAGGPLEVSHVGPTRRVVVEHWSIGAHDLFLARGDGLRLARTARHVRAEPKEAVRIGYQMRGGYALVSGPHSERGFAGAVNLADHTQPCAFTQRGDGAAAVSFEISYGQLGVAVEVVRKAMGRLPASPLYGLLQGHLARLCQAVRVTAGEGARPLVADATRQLATATVLSAAGTDHEVDVLGRVLYERIVEYVAQNLADARLTPSRIAAAHGISLRHLYRIWSRNEIPIAEWILSERLSRAAQDLRDPAFGTASIAAIAGRWGFVDHAHFSHRFRRSYAMPPTEWRRLG